MQKSLLLLLAVAVLAYSVHVQAQNENIPPGPALTNPLGPESIVEAAPRPELTEISSAGDNGGSKRKLLQGTMDMQTEEPAVGSSLLPSTIYAPTLEMEIFREQQTALEEQQSTPVGRRLLNSF